MKSKCSECDSKVGPFHSALSFFGKPIEVCEKCFQEMEGEEEPKESAEEK